MSTIDLKKNELKKSLKKSKDYSENLLASTWNSSTAIPLRSKSTHRRDAEEKLIPKRDPSAKRKKPLEAYLSPCRGRQLTVIDPVMEYDEKLRDIHMKDLKVKLSGVYSTSSRLAQPTISSS